MFPNTILSLKAYSSPQTMLFKTFSSDTQTLYFFNNTIEYSHFSLFPKIIFKIRRLLQYIIIPTTRVME